VNAFRKPESQGVLPYLRQPRSDANGSLLGRGLTESLTEVLMNVAAGHLERRADRFRQQSEKSRFQKPEDEVEAHHTLAHRLTSVRQRSIWTLPRGDRRRQGTSSPSWRNQRLAVAVRRGGTVIRA
jgi:hypothetical protein